LDAAYRAAGRELTAAGAEWHENYGKMSKFPVEGFDGGSVSVLTTRVG
jgi:hypothetical protein